jgi:exodeoxyribonuclease VII small subunit
MPKKTKPDDLKDLSFEQALKKLDETVQALEGGELPLDETTKLYEQGMRLANRCTELLSKAELKITQIQTAYGGGGEALEDETLSGDS